MFPCVSTQFEDGSVFYSIEPFHVHDGPFIGYNGFTQKLFDVKFKLGPSDWFNFCIQIDFSRADISYVANGVVYYKGPHTSLQTKENMVVTSLVLMKHINCRLADVFLLNYPVSEEKMIAFTACKAEFPDNTIQFGPHSWAVSGSNRNLSLAGEPLFLPRFCETKKTLVLPSSGFIENADKCKRFGKFSFQNIRLL